MGFRPGMIDGMGVAGFQAPNWTCTAGVWIPNSELDGYIKLLLHCDGANGGTIFTDSSFPPKTVTGNGNAQTSTAQSVFGGASLLLDGTGDYLTLANSADWDFGSGNFTIEGRFRFSAAVKSGLINYGYVWNAGGNLNWSAVYDGAGNLYFGRYNDVDGEFSKSVAWTPSVDTWYHIAIVRSGNNLYFFVNGSQVGATQDITGITLRNNSQSLYVGYYQSGAVAKYFNGYIDEVRVSKGIARWTSNFTIPSSAYSNIGPQNFAVRNYGKQVGFQAEFTTSPGIPGGVVVRWSDANNYVIAYHDGVSTLKLDKVIAGTPANLVTSTVAYGAGQIPKITWDDANTANVWYNGVSKGTGDCSAVPPGDCAGMFGTGPENQFVSPTQIP